MTALSSSNNTQVGNASPPNDTEMVQTHLKTIMRAFADDPTEICNELVAHCGMPKAAEILREAAAYVPFLEQIVQQKKNAILRIRAEAKHHEAETKRRERELRQIVKVGMTSKEDMQPFVEHVAGYSKPGLDSSPKKQRPSLVASWMEARIKTAR